MSKGRGVAGRSFELKVVLTTSEKCVVQFRFNPEGDVQVTSSGEQELSIKKGTQKFFDVHDRSGKRPTQLISLVVRNFCSVFEIRGSLKASDSEQSQRIEVDRISGIEYAVVGPAEFKCVAV